MNRAVLFGAALTVAATVATPSHAQFVGEDAVEIVEILLGVQPERHGNSPLAAMKGRSELYAKYLERAREGDDASVRLWLLQGAVALLRTDAATAQEFSADLVPVYSKHQQKVLKALSDAPWLTHSTCYYLGNHFDFEGRNGAGRDEFLAGEGERILAALEGPRASMCLELIEQPKRPDL